MQNVSMIKTSFKIKTLIVLVIIQAAAFLTLDTAIAEETPQGWFTPKGGEKVFSYEPLIGFCNGLDDRWGFGFAYICLSHSAYGIQLGVFSNAANLYGTQLGVFYNMAEDMNGLQIGLFNLAMDSIYGAQISAVNIGASNLKGLQIGGLLNLFGGSFYGAQISPINIFSAGDVFRGIQLAGLFNIYTEKMIGFQLSPLLNVKKEKDSSFTGFQVSMLNINEKTYGVQIGVVNYTSTLYGLQLGLINIAGNGMLPFFPIFNVGWQ